MAGIAGWVEPARRAGDEAALGPMLGALAHRGMEGLCGYVDRGERHQAVLGASLCDRPSRIALVLDGTLVNAGELRAQLAAHGFRFAGQSGEEVLLRAYQYWDRDAMKKLRGAFALALWDARKDRLLLARDRFGEKPLYLHQKNGALYFASEAKALLRAGVAAKVDLSAVSDCLAYRYVPGPRTLFAGIRKLAPASYALWQSGKLHEARYWIAPDRNRYAGRDAPADAAAGLLACLEEAVKLQRASGVLLSGGLDSAVLLALMCKSGGAAPATFSLGLEGDRASELPRAAALARHFGTAHQEIVVAPRELAATLPRLVACRDAPVPRASDLAVHRLASEAAARGAKTVLSGDGCDEIVGGYRRYVADRICGGVQAFPARLFAPLVSGGRFDRAAAPLKLNGWRHRFSTLEESAGVALDADPRASRLRRALYADQMRWLPDHLLERNDRAAAAASLDARMPFLDHRVAEYVSTLPDDQRVRGLTTKWILRTAARKLIPAPLARLRKGGWRIDVGGWLRNDLRDFTLEHLRAASSVTRCYYDPAALDRVLDEHLKGSRNHETLIWTLLNIEIWHRSYKPG
jgi:asparagine synthase (glutamine-hydrolysing)